MYSIISIFMPCDIYAFWSMYFIYTRIAFQWRGSYKIKVILFLWGDVILLTMSLNVNPDINDTENGFVK